MTASVFFDTNILVYAATVTGKDERKRQRAMELVESENFGTSAQVLQEFIVAAASKKRLGIGASEAKATLGALLAFPTVPITAGLVLQAWEIKTRYQISYWDAAIIAAAKELGCEVIYSEDLNNGQSYAWITVCNPFART